MVFHPRRPRSSPLSECHPDGVLLPSNIEGAGDGLFATEPFRKGTSEYRKMENPGEHEEDVLEGDPPTPEPPFAFQFSKIANLLLPVWVATNRDVCHPFGQPPCVGEVLEPMTCVSLK